MVLSLMTILALLPHSQYTEHLRKIEIGGTSINDVTVGLWDWASGDDDGEGDEGVRLVVFGDSWVDDRIEKNGDGKGRSWTEVLCEELACTSQINLAASQPAASYPSSPPTGAFASNKIYLSSIKNTIGQNNPETKLTSEAMLPDLEAQVKSFIALPRYKKKLKETIFVLSFGTWDVWHYAALDYAQAQDAQNKAVKEMFAQLDTLYAHHRETLEATHVIEKPHNESHVVPKPQFRVVIPKLFDPTMLPGWLSQRPVPLKPDSVAENQKNAIYLLRDWDNKVENSIQPWFASTPEATTTNEWTELSPDTISSEDEKENEAITEIFEQNDQENKSQTPREESGEKAQIQQEIPPPQKDIYYYDLNRFLTEIILEHQLEDEGLSDASGLGTKESPYISVYDPCVREGSGSGGGNRRGNEKDIHGMLVCEAPDEYLFWDAFGMGSKAKERVGREIANMVKGGKTLRAAWGDGRVPGVGVGVSV
ncbi:hypothetical protein SBOR_6747 [Sclerotinia borealis F-4128]|uniref:SGNH hydrolase-type esterase domain-containing protein n=1 Tax=Sclerotinia borealis (strain F-4128) TaxID=1432307 RepID=W9CDK4_SCLBF|nr:hypothetical protein SBOR_6747 [Sclerotinia borealis F-4128]